MDWDRITICGIQELYDVYDTLDDGHVMSIVSADGFLEASQAEPSLFERMVNLIDRGIHVRYYYPRGPDNPSIKDYCRLMEAYEKAVGHELLLERVSGFQIGPSRGDLFGWQSRFIVVSRWNEARDTIGVESVFLYIDYARREANGEQTNDAARAWIRLADAAAQQYHTSLCQATEPIRNLGVYTNRLASQIQDNYRHCFGNPASLSTYNNLRSMVDTESRVHELFCDDRFSEWFNGVAHAEPDFPIIRLLDIGTGDGSPTAAMLDELEKALGATGTVHLTTVESAHVPSAKRHKNIDKLHTAWFETPFEDWNPGEHQFELITAIHSLYLIDPSYMMRMYDLLSDEGMMLVISAPAERNMINLICRVVDGELPTADPSIQRLVPYRGKVITTDPFRNYAEDLHSMAKAYFHEAAVVERKLQQNVDKPYFIDSEGGLTKFARELVSLFSCGWLGQEHLQRVEEEILRQLPDILRKEDGLANDIWAFTVAKCDVRQHLGRYVNGRLE